MRARTIRVSMALVAVSVAGWGQIDPQPKLVHRVANGASIGDFSLASVELAALRSGSPQVARIKINAPGAARTLRFESIDANAKLIDILPAVKDQDGEYLVLVNIPAKPFRVRTVGLDLTDMAYERVFRRLFQPTPANQAAKGSGAVCAELLERFVSEKQAHPDGTITLSSIDVYAVGYEPLVSNGNVSGIRVWYSVRFAKDGEYSLSPAVFPIYDDPDSRGLVAMRTLREKVDPMPEKVGSAVKYRGGTEYRVVLDMIPDYVVANSYQTKFCIYEAKFPASGKGRDAWNLVKSNPTPVRYRVEIPGLNFTGETELFHPQRTFYEGFLKQGAFDCGSAPDGKL